jgi:acyl-CoA reductase-like NAD-dependent aldehyde dehydrogenase
MITDTVLASRDFAGVHFTGSTNVFKGIWAKLERINHYKTYPRIVGKQVEKISSSHQAQTLNKFLQELCVDFSNSKEKCSALQGLMCHKVCGQQ